MLTRSGELFDVESETLERIHFQFGETWRVNEVKHSFGLLDLIFRKEIGQHGTNILYQILNLCTLYKLFFMA